MDVAFHIYRASLVVEKKIGSFRYILIFINEKIFHKTFFFFSYSTFYHFFFKKKIYYDYLICILLKPSVLAPRILFIFFVLFYFIVL